MKTIFFIIGYSVLSISVRSKIDFDPVTSPLLKIHPCEDEDIVIWFDPGLPPREKNRYYVVVNKVMPKGSTLSFSFDSDVHIIRITSHDYTQYVKEFLSDEEQTLYTFTTDSNGYGFIVKGAIPGTSPYLTSLVLNNQEFCNTPKMGYFEKIISETYDGGPYSKCGKRKVEYTELIVNGDATKPGDWPWHVAIYKVKPSALSYICGGTLISKYFILTAAHCVTKNGIAVEPKTLHVALGKHNLIGEEQESQEKEVHRVIVHKKFKKKNFDNDIALLKLRSEVVFSNYVQSACLWYSKLQSPKKVFGTVVGWGFDSSDFLTSKLRQAKMPIVPKNKCIKSKPLFYGEMLNNNNFCAGYHNGTSVCNGDSGSGFHIFIPDEDIEKDGKGAWYLRGIVSATLARKDQPICDSTQYAVFTDVEKLRLWIDSYLDNEID